MAKNKLNLFLTSSKIDFKKPLLPNDKFYITCKLIPEGRIRFIFEQEVRLSDNTLIAIGYNTGVCMDGNKNKPYIPKEILEYLTKQI